MHSFAMCPFLSKALIFPDRYGERKPKPAKDPAQQHLSEKGSCTNNFQYKYKYANIMLLT